MITGTVNARHEITINLALVDALGQPRDLVAILDTGFSGDLTLPAAVVGALGLAWVNRDQLVLGSGQIEEFEVYLATIVWDGHPKTILVQAIEAMPLVGMRLLIGHDLRVRIVPGGDVELAAIP